MNYFIYNTYNKNFIKLHNFFISPVILQNEKLNNKKEQLQAWQKHAWTQITLKEQKQEEISWGKCFKTSSNKKLVQMDLGTEGGDETR